MKTTLTVGMSPTTWNTEPYRSMGLRITDRPSGILIASVNLGPEDYMQMIGGQTHVEADVPDVDQWARVGLTMQTRSVMAPRELTKGWPRDEHLDLAKVWGRRAAEPGEVVDAHHTNAGIRVIYRKWVDQ